MSRGPTRQGRGEYQKGSPKDPQKLHIAPKNRNGGKNRQQGGEKVKKDAPVANGPEAPDGRVFLPEENQFGKGDGWTRK